MALQRVLFLCTGNSARSQMAEGLVNHLLGGRWQAFSAGTQPAGQVHPLAVQAMAEIDIDISAQRPKPLTVYEGQTFDVVLTLCTGAAESCAFWPGHGPTRHMGFTDPAQATGTPEELLQAFREVRDALRAQVFSFLANWPDGHKEEKSCRAM